jgi:hypothetical protein
MSVIKNTLQENYVYFIRELARIDEELKGLPVGSVSLKKIGNSTYYYRQWREGRKVKTASLGLNVPSELLDGINRRRLLEKQRKEILDNLNVIAKAIDTQKVTADEIIKLFSQHGIRAVLVGSYCLPVMKDELGLNLPTIKTQDIDFLVNVPYRGNEVDIESILRAFGFSRGFNPDGSSYFTNGVFKVEFLTPERGKGADKAVYIRRLKIGAAPLRYLQMLLDHPVKIEKEDYTFLIPSPWIFAYHKILVSGKRKVKDKKDKDILQAIALLREISKRPDMSKKAAAYLEKLPAPWAKRIKSEITKYLPDFAL